MKATLCVLILIGHSCVLARDKIDLKNIEKGVDKMISVHRESGQVGQIVKISECYDELGKLDKESPWRYKKFEYCLAMDLAASKFDYDYASSKGFPQLEFLLLGNISLRIKPFVADLDLPPSNVEKIMSHVVKYFYTSFKKIYKY